ncbi:MAG TPA: ABC transporter permease [Longimicrobiaceae bacterium]|nr:ABC transporter permease [Longimicrobiaceae bacterium]
MIGTLRVLARAFRTPSGVAGGLLTSGVFVLAITGPFLAPMESNHVDLSARLASPSAKHLFGTDELGRDLLSRVLDGASRTVPAAIVVVASAVVIGVALGAIAGYYGRFIDTAIMRVTDIFIGYPALLLAIAIAAALGVGMVQTVVALAAVWWAGYARLVRGQTTAVRQLLFIEAAKVNGVGGARILWSHILPNIMAPVIVKATVDLALVVESVAALGFIGLGAQPPAAEWGSMVANSQTYALQAWWYPLFPGLALLIVVLGSNLLGDGLTQALGSVGHVMPARGLTQRWLRLRRPRDAQAA